MLALLNFSIMSQVPLVALDILFASLKTHLLLLLMGNALAYERVGC